MNTSQLICRYVAPTVRVGELRRERLHQRSRQDMEVDARRGLVLVEQRVPARLGVGAVLVDDRAHEPVAVAEVVLERAGVALPGGAVDLAERDPVDAAARESRSADRMIVPRVSSFDAVVDMVSPCVREWCPAEDTASDTKATRIRLVWTDAFRGDHRATHAFLRIVVCHRVALGGLRPGHRPRPAVGLALGRQRLRPIIFVHGFSGSGRAVRVPGAAVHEQRLPDEAHRGPRIRLAVRDRDAARTCSTRLDQRIEEAAARQRGADKIDLLGHSLGTTLMQEYLNS